MKGGGKRGIWAVGLAALLVLLFAASWAREAYFIKAARGGYRLAVEDIARFRG